MIEKYLVQERDIEEVMKLARSSKAKDTRTAAYELATMAASSDDNKFRIVAESGWVYFTIHVKLLWNYDHSTIRPLIWYKMFSNSNSMVLCYDNRYSTYVTGH